MSTPDVPEPITPARAPERKASLEEDELKLGSGEEETTQTGRQALRRPSGLTVS